MRKTDIERIIKQGSTRQKIKLYFTDGAYFNTKGIYTSDINRDGELEVNDRILSDKERDLIYNSIKEPKDIKYWEELRTLNKAFLMFKPTITTYTQTFKYLTAQVSKYTLVRLLHIVYEDSINDILEVVEDKKLREKLVNTALKSLKKFNAVRYQEEGYLPFIEIPEAEIDKARLVIKVLNEKIKEAKEYIEVIRTFLNKLLPLQPYKEFLNEAEDNIKGEIKECRKLVKACILEKIVDDILNWEEVEVEVTDEDIEDIKNAGR